MTMIPAEKRRNNMVAVVARESGTTWTMDPWTSLDGMMCNHCAEFVFERMNLRFQEYSNKD
eukprot:CAMPEP_0113639064 /NCGR_PEP_ID=MMETSP0017_2-20120614/20481_1 /TAXON_ID=2856 /ORGANISM="Cylindrotheca closterium" /LENGTH=60 /DNA_ID=CAMNT_0000550235 /DNA_START=291 /DNA_END=473 /DNA_ORIENTATION=+ /assembly_acc=CAM_ASM_000147